MNATIGRSGKSFGEQRALPKLFTIRVRRKVLTPPLTTALTMASRRKIHSLLRPNWRQPRVHTTLQILENPRLPLLSISKRLKRFKSLHHLSHSTTTCHIWVQLPLQRTDITPHTSHTRLVRAVSPPERTLLGPPFDLFNYCSFHCNIDHYSSEGRTNHSCHEIIMCIFIWAKGVEWCVLDFILVPLSLCMPEQNVYRQTNNLSHEACFN